MNEQRVYQTKRDILLGALIWIPTGGFLLYALYEQEWIGVVILGLATLFTCSIWFGTNYRIEGDLLKIKSGLVRFESIDINQIREIEETKTWLSSPACSLDRIVIRYKQFDEIVISPKEKEMFVAHLKEINSRIVILI